MISALKGALVGLFFGVVAFVVFLPGMLAFGPPHPNTVAYLLWEFISGIVAISSTIWLANKVGIAKTRPKKWVRRLLRLSDLPPSN